MWTEPRTLLQPVSLVGTGSALPLQFAPQPFVSYHDLAEQQGRRLSASACSQLPCVT